MPISAGIKSLHRNVLIKIDPTKTNIARVKARRSSSRMFFSISCQPTLETMKYIRHTLMHTLTTITMNFSAVLFIIFHCIQILSGHPNRRQSLLTAFKRNNETPYDTKVFSIPSLMPHPVILFTTFRRAVAIADSLLRLYDR